jgi:surface-anchored protein
MAILAGCRTPNESAALTMKTPLLLFASFLSLASAPNQLAQCYTFTHEHVDLLAVQWNPASNALGLMASDDDHGGTLYASNQCVVVCPESMRFTLPADTPLGSAGDPLWILPQNPYEGVPYVGVSSEALMPGSFQNPLTIQLLRVEGPGHFLVWQATGFGSFDLKMDSRDGIGPNDQLTPFVGGHEHHNWGFTTSGVYRVYFQASGRRPGQTADLVSPETPFTFHVLPLRSFESWVATNWPCECATNIIAAAADPDGDQAPNGFEYGVGTSPTRPDTNAWSVPSIIQTDSQQYGALTFQRSKSAPDATCMVVASSSLFPAGWQLLTNLHSLEDLGTIAQVTIRDILPLNESRQRFYQLRVVLDPGLADSKGISTAGSQ